MRVFAFAIISFSTFVTAAAGAFLLQRGSSYHLSIAKDLPQIKRSNNHGIRKDYKFRIPLRSASLQTVDIPSIEPPNNKNKNEKTTTVTICKYCNKPFASRNAFFRHVRTDVDCRQKAMEEAERENRLDEVAKSIFAKSKKRSLVMQVGYNTNEYFNTTAAATVVAAEPSSVVVAEFLKESFTNSLCSLQGIDVSDLEQSWLDKNIVFSQASATKVRPRALTQDVDCAAAGDVFSVNYRFDRSDTTDLISILNDALKKDDIRNRSGYDIEVIAVEKLPTNTNLNVERACTQRVYHYLLPLSWLPDAMDTASWCINLEKQKKIHNSDSSKQKSSRFGLVKRNHDKRNSGPPTLKRLKKCLKLITKGNHDTNAYRKKSTGRFGVLNEIEKICWHNFADPALKGLASPNNSPVWRSIDRVRIAEIVLDDKIKQQIDNRHSSFEQDIGIAIEIRGDSFISQQVRRIIGSVIAIVHGWLPEDFFIWATRPDIVLETPLAPAGFCYLAGARFDFSELILRRAFFRSQANDIEKQRAWIRNLHGSMLKKIPANQEEEDWLTELRDNIAPRIRNQLKNYQQVEVSRQNNEYARKDLGLSLPKLGNHEKTSYMEVLSHVRDILEMGKWPTTSIARSRIIRAEMNAPNAISPSFINKSGSFTVVNTNADSDISLPQGNILFPDLVTAVFKLEEILCIENNIKRNPSTHCAINCCAEFTPHVDSGRGMGQSLSMIVGLGNYDGGGLYLEGDLHNIRYSPLEFDGWRLRHWTEPFNGERYSIVWFTPESKKTKKKGEEDKEKNLGNLDDDIVGNSSIITTTATKLDSMTKQLVFKHTRDFLPSFPPIRYREDSTDALVIKELLNLEEKGSAYQLRGDPSWNNLDTPLDFSLTLHNNILDVGAHIGVFVRYALGEGCRKIKAYEPEKENFNLLRQNTITLPDNTANGEENNYDIDIYNSAVAQVERPGKASFSYGVDNHGVKNTWRHSLSEYSHYKVKEEDLKITTVDVVPFFGTKGVLEPGITFVKLDCEGAEIGILLSQEASDSNAWMDVTHLVVEWSFTKEKSIAVFHEAIKNLENAGFFVTYEGKGTFWDAEEGGKNEWPFFTDLLVFAARQN